MCSKLWAGCTVCSFLKDRVSVSVGHAKREHRPTYTVESRREEYAGEECKTLMGRHLKMEPAVSACLPDHTVHVEWGNVATLGAHEVGIMGLMNMYH